MSRPPTLWCVADDVPPETLQLLEAAARAEGVAFCTVRPGDPEPRPADNDLLFRPAISAEAMALERRLWRPGLRSFWTTPDGPFAVPAFPPTVLDRARVATPRWADLPSAHPPALDAAVARVGPPPWVVKIPGHAGGHGVFRVDSRPALASLADYLLTEGQTPWLMAWLPGVHWRVVVAGDAAVAAYPNPTRPGDFRTYGTEDPAEVLAQVPPALAQPAVAACAALGVAHGGVDLILPPDGPAAVLETNFPCYFAHAELLAGVPVAAAMVRALRARPPADAAAPCARPAHPLWLVEDDEAPYNAALLSEALRAAGQPFRRAPVVAGVPADATPGRAIQASWSVAAWRLASALGGVPDHAPSLLALTEGVEAGPARWRALVVGDAIVACEAVEPGAPPPPAPVEAVALAAARRARRPWLQVELAGPPHAPVARGLYHPPDLASFSPDAARAAAAARAALTAAPAPPTVMGSR